jgi:tRNA dimethylallyltransferase
MQPPLIVIVGPTAVGKTETSIRLAERIGGEIISADSRQFYRGLDIGTAKATAAERTRIPHHLLDICDPTETLTLAQFQRMVYDLAAEITARGKIPMLVGGTGLYVKAIVEGYGIPEVPPNEAVRERLMAIAEAEGGEVLYQQLVAVDPVAAETIDGRNVRRVVRALEVYEVTGIPISVLQRKVPPPYRVLQLGLIRPREILYQRADFRIAKMLQEGLVQEVQGLLDVGVPAECEAMSGLGYRETVAYLRGELADEATLAQEIGRTTRRLIRTQSNWFRATDPTISWFDLERKGYEEIETFVVGWLTSPLSDSEIGE